MAPKKSQKAPQEGKHQKLLVKLFDVMKVNWLECWTVLC